MSDLYFDTTDIAKTNEDFKRGDVVRMYKEGTQLQYPCIVLSCTHLEAFRVEAIKGVLGSRNLVNSENENYNVFIDMSGDLIMIGVIPNERLKFVLTNGVFDIFGKKVHLDPETTVTGDMLFALCVI